MLTADSNKGGVRSSRGQNIYQKCKEKFVNGENGGSD